MSFVSLPRDRIRRQVSTQDPEEVLVVTRLRQVVLWACWHGDEVAPKILVAVRVFGLREQTPRRDVLARRRQTITSKASTVHCFWLISEYTDRYITVSKKSQCVQDLPFLAACCRNRKTSHYQD
jgi:hypothetical protein